MNSLKETLVKSCLMLAVLFVAIAPAMANGNPTDEREMTIAVKADKHSESVLVFLNNIPAQGAHVTIKDLNGVVLVSEKVKTQTSFAKKYNLVNLPAGDYVVVVENNKREMIQPITLTDEAVVINKSNQELIQKPDLDFMSNKLVVRANWNTEMPMKMVISDQKGNTVYDEFIKATTVFGKTYDLSKLPGGHYTAYLIAGNKVYEQTVFVK